MNNKLVLPVSSLASAAVAFGLGAMIFTNGNTPADAATAQPKATATAPAKPAQKPADAHETSTSAPESKAAKAGAKAAAQAGDNGPFKDAQGDGKYLDDLGKSVMPNGLGVHVPDAVLPWHEHYEAPTTEATPESVTSDDVVSAPNVVTDPDKPWFDLPTAPPADAATSANEPAPEPVANSGPVRNSGMTTGKRPVFNTPTDTVSSAVPE